MHGMLFLDTAVNQWFSVGASFASEARGHLAVSTDIGCLIWGLLLLSGRWRPGTLPSILQCTGRTAPAPQKELTWPEMLTVPSVRSAGVRKATAYGSREVAQTQCFSSKIACTC